MTRTELKSQDARTSYTLPVEVMTESGLDIEPTLHAYHGENCLAIIPASMTSLEVVNSIALFSQMVELLTEVLEESGIVIYE